MEAPDSQHFVFKSLPISEVLRFNLASVSQVTLEFNLAAAGSVKREKNENTCVFNTPAIPQRLKYKIIRLQVLSLKGTHPEETQQKM